LQQQPQQPQYMQVQPQLAAPAPQRFGGGGGGGGGGSRVMVLLEMVGPDEVNDPALPGEVAEECSKYGPVEGVRVALRRSATTGAPEVGVFVAFRTVEGAAAGMVALDRRYFGGRITAARPYPESAFYAGDLQQRV
jgi:hypothetical protein